MRLRACGRKDNLVEYCKEARRLFAGFFGDNFNVLVFGNKPIREFFGFQGQLFGRIVLQSWNMEIKVVKDSIKRGELIKMASEEFGDIVKAVVDVAQGIMAVGGELHADEEVLLVEKEGSRREDTWGINIYPQKPESEWIEFDSMINLKPAFGNRSRDVENPETKEKIKRIARKLIAE